MLLNDKFLKENLNPLFLGSMEQFWIALEQAKKDNPEQVKLAQYNLLLFIFRRLLQPLYLKYVPIIKGRVCFLTKVHTDGIGDYFSLLKCAKLLKEAHPQLDVQAAYTCYQSLPEVKLEDYLLSSKTVHSFFEESEKPVLEPILKGEEEDVSSSQQVQAEQLYDAMKESLAIVHIALALNTFDNPRLASKSFYFSETGNFQGIGNYLQRNWFSMGLLPFEEGIFLKKTFPKQSEWVNPKLADIFKDPHHRVYLGYLSKIPEQLTLFINLVVLLEKKAEGEITILIPKLIKKGEISFNKDWLNDQGISQLIISKDGKDEVLLDTGVNTGKTLRFLPIFPVVTSDFEKINQLCADIVGCTGDGSLSDCIIAGKIPFYELRTHKQETWQSFQILAEASKLADISDYFKVLTLFRDKPLETIAEELRDIIQITSFKSQWNTLISFIYKYGCFEDSLLSHLNRQFHHINRPDLIALEQELIKNFFNGTQSAQEVYTALENELN